MYTNNESPVVAATGDSSLFTVEQTEVSCCCLCRLTIYRYSMPLYLPARKEQTIPTQCTPPSCCQCRGSNTYYFNTLFPFFNNFHKSLGTTCFIQFLSFSSAMCATLLFSMNFGQYLSLKVPFCFFAYHTL